MKLRNKKTGEVKYFAVVVANGYVGNDTLKELNEEWEDYEEPKSSALDLTILTLTNFIENEPDENKVDLEDCKRLLEKLKAWKRLKDKGIKDLGWGWYKVENPYREDDGVIYIKILFDTKTYDCSWDDDLHLLFGGEE